MRESDALFFCYIHRGDSSKFAFTLDLCYNNYSRKRKMLLINRSQNHKSEELNMKLKRIYKRAMAEFLIDRGCHLIKTVPDVVNPSRLNWIFEDTLQLQMEMENFPKRGK